MKHVLATVCRRRTRPRRAGRPPRGEAPADDPLERYAADTWASLDAMTDETTGLPSDNIGGDLTAPAAYTSPTNIGGYLWSTVTARDLGIISEDDARERMATTLTTLETLERNTASGMFYNWYDPATGAKLTTWPDSGDVVHPFLSTVDNGWLAAGLRIVREAEPSLACPGRQPLPFDGLRRVLQPRGCARACLPARTAAASGRSRLRTAASPRRCTTARASRRSTPATTTTPP